MSPTPSLKNDSTSDERPAVAFVESTSWLAKVHPYFKDPSHVLVLKLDVLLLVWAFIAGLFKVTDHIHPISISKPTHLRTWINLPQPQPTSPA